MTECYKCAQTTFSLSYYRDCWFYILITFTFFSFYYHCISTLVQSTISGALVYGISYTHMPCTYYSSEGATTSFLVSSLTSLPSTLMSQSSCAYPSGTLSNLIPPLNYSIVFILQISNEWRSCEASPDSLCLGEMPITGVPGTDCTYLMTTHVHCFAIPPLMFASLLVSYGFFLIQHGTLSV